MTEKKYMLAGSIAAAGLAAILIFLSSATEQRQGIKRTELQRHNLADSGTEAIQVRIDFGKGTAFGRHTHPGEEIIYVLEGMLEYQVSEKPPVTLRAGNVLFVPAGVIHSARNAGNCKASELATYLVRKGKPLLLMEQQAHPKNINH